MKKKIMIGFLGIFLCIMILQISPIRGANFKVEDDTADLTYYNNSTQGNPGSGVHDEIDIDYVEIDGVSILVSFVAAPNNSAGYEYSFRIYWIGDDPLGNWTKGTWSNTHNQVHTRIEDGSGAEIVDEWAYDVIYPVGVGLIIPIYNTSMIPTILDPHIVAIHTQFTIAEGEQYTDNLDYATGTFPFPGFTFWITMSGLSLIIMIGLVMNKKKN